MAVAARAIPEVTAAGRMLEEFADKQPVGSVVSYGEWNKVAHLDVKEHRSVLLGAFRRLKKRTRAVWSVVRNVGYKRMDDAGKLDAAHHEHKASVRKAKKALGTLAAIEDVTALPERSQCQYHGLSNRVIIMIAVGSSRTKALDQNRPEEFSARTALRALTDAIFK